MAALFFCAANACSNQPNNTNESAAKPAAGVGGPCESCEIMYIDMPGNIDAVDTSAGWQEAGQKLLITGTVYKQDGKTPAPGIIIYYWQTGNNGLYSPAEGLNEKAKRHGHIRGWMKTSHDGKYALYTLKPAPYPNSNNPSHIHPLIKEPNIANEYYFDEFLFDDDSLLTAEKRKNLENRCGNGIVKTSLQNAVLVAERDIVLGLNIPGYPKE